MLRVKMRYGIIKVFYDLVHDITTIVPGFVKIRVVGFKLTLIPRNIPEANHEVSVGIGAEEPSKSHIFFPDTLILTVVRIFNQGVEPADIGKTPSVA